MKCPHVSGYAKGTMRQYGQPKYTRPKSVKYPHKCTECGQVKEFKVRYPMQRWSKE